MATTSFQHNYGECSYWEQRYQKQPVAFDWYQGFPALAELLESVFPRNSRLLQVGVGTSRLQEGMARAGWQHIDNIDYSQVVISHMAQLHQGLPQLTYRVADARSMPEVQDGAYDGVIDKGTLDAMLCGAGSTRSSLAMLAECCRVLSPTGALMIVTYGDPSSRLQYLDQPLFGWSVQVYYIAQVVPPGGEGLQDDGEAPTLLRGPFDSKQVEVMRALGELAKVHYVYVCRKSPELIERALAAAAQQREQEQIQQQLMREQQQEVEKEQEEEEQEQEEEQGGEEESTCDGGTETEEYDNVDAKSCQEQDVM